MHSDTNNAFWAAVHKGFKDACAQIDADCQMLTLSGDGDQQEQLQNFESSIAQGVDGIVTTISHQLTSVYKLFSLAEVILFTENSLYLSKLSLG